MGAPRWTLRELIDFEVQASESAPSPNELLEKIRAIEGDPLTRKRNGLLLSMMLAAALSLFLVLALAFNGTLWGGDLQGDFYRLFPHNLLVTMFLPVFAWAVLALGVGVTRFLRDVGPFTSAQAATAGDLSGAAQDALTLKYLDGGHGDG
jgi:citrate/tricarballylate utilization protein